MNTDPDGRPYRHNAEQHEAHKAALAESVSVADFLPFWRYAVGPTSGRSPAIPFYRLSEATAFFDEAQRELPWSGVVLYRRRLFRPLELIREYLPAPRFCRGCGQKWTPDTSNTLCPVCESPDTIKL